MPDWLQLVISTAVPMVLGVVWMWDRTDRIRSESRQSAARLHRRIDDLAEDLREDLAGIREHLGELRGVGTAAQREAAAAAAQAEAGRAIGSAIATHAQECPAGRAAMLARGRGR